MIGVIGLDYKTADINERELFSLSREQQVDLSKTLIAQTEFTGIVILFTCNRTEIYFSSNHYCNEKDIANLLVGVLKEYLGIEKVSRQLYFKTDESAIKHLFGVISGYESMIFGEAQIVTQVREAYFQAERLETMDTNLKRLFEKAFETGKKVRTETKINQGAFSVSYAGIEKCRTIYSDLWKKKIFIIGAGKTGEITLATLLKKGCSNIKITNRSFEKARYLSQKFNVGAVDFSRMNEVLIDSDIVFVATASHSYLLSRERIETILIRRKGIPMVIVDYSVPRNVDPAVKSLEGITLFNVDYLQNVLEENRLNRRKLMKQGLGIIEQASKEYTDWLNLKNLKPVITRLNYHFSRINEKELEGFKKVSLLTD